MIKACKTFETRDALAAALAHDVAVALTAQLAARGTATLAVSGGTTPQLFFQHLAAQDIAWHKVVVTLVDERQVSEASPRSNAALVKKSLLQGKAAKARFVPLFENVDEAASLTLGVVVLGMGNDGHTASFFPGGDTLAQALDHAATNSIVAVSAPASGEPRLTYTLSKLLAASTLCLHIEGDEKLQVLEKALAGDDILEMPVRAVLAAATPIKLYWCP